MSIYKNGKLVAGGRQCMPLLSFVWADHVLNDASWLRADTFSWHNGATYRAAYMHLWNDITKRAEWLLSLGSEKVYTKKKYPNVGDDVFSNTALTDKIGTVSSVNYTRIGSPSIRVNGSLYNFNAWNYVSSNTETIAGTTITYYLADDGHKIVLAGQESNVTAIYNATGVAWYYILDTTNQRFKLPRTKYGFAGLRDTVGNYVPESLPNITGAFWIDSYYAASPDGAFTATDNYSAPNHGNWAAEGWRIHLDASRSSSAYQNGAPVQQRATQMYLYFYVGNFTQTALENTAGVTTEVLNTKVTIGHEVVEFQEPTAANNYTWYRKYRDGWVEQGGQFVKAGGQYALNEQTLPVPMANTAYYANVIFGGGAGDSTIDLGITRTTTTLKIYPTWSTTGQSCPWFVSGMAA